MNESTARIHCRIFACAAETQYALERIARTCAIDLHLVDPITMIHCPTQSIGDTRIALTIPLEIAVTHESVWKLASRIACFCPQAQVSAQVSTEPLAC